MRSQVSGPCSPSFLGLNLMTLLRGHTEEGDVVLTDSTEELSPIFKVYQ